MMTGKVVTTYSSQGQLPKNATAENELLSSTSNRYSPVEVATAVTFAVALIQVIFYRLVTVFLQSTKYLDLLERSIYFPTCRIFKRKIVKGSELTIKNNSFFNIVYHINGITALQIF